MSHERIFLGRRRHFFMVVYATFPKPGKTEGCILGTPHHEPEAAAALPREGWDWSALGRGVRFLRILTPAT